MEEAETMEVAEEVAEVKVNANPFEHPITMPGALRFRLVPALEVLDEFSELSASGDVGMAVHGNYRSGKTTLMRDLIERFERNKLMVVFHSVQESSKSRARSASGTPRLARQLRNSKKGGLSVSALSEVEALCNFAQVTAERAGTRRVLFLIDEAQYLSDEQLSGLKAIIEALISRGLAPFVVLFGQPEMVALADRLKKEEPSLSDRFFLRLVRMRGLDLREFAEFLANFDTKRWPEAGGPTYTQFWLQDFWGRGGRLESLSAHFESSFKKVCREFRRSAADIPVKYLANAACRTLRVGSKEMRNGKAIADVIEESVRRSGIIESFSAGDLEAAGEKSTARSRVRQAA